MGESLNKIPTYAVLTARETLVAELQTVASGVSLYKLMQTAGMAVYKEITERFVPCPTVVLCGPGNNGGDGYVVATLLEQAGWPVKVATQSFTTKMSDFATKHRNNYQGKVVKLDAQAMEGCKLVIDGLFGTGLERALIGDYASMVEAVNASGIDCLAIDIPSGVHTDTGAVMGVAIKAHTTVTFSYRKPGQLLLPGRIYTGNLICRSIDLTDVPSEQIHLMVNRPQLWDKFLPKPNLTDHKYSRGHLLIRGGEEMTGAGRLAAAAARRIGAGMVTIACAPSVRQIYALSAPGLITTELNEAHSFKSRLLEKSKSAVLLGPGNGITKETRQAVLDTLDAKTPCVLDADALTVFQDDPETLFNRIMGPCILTPHAGEFKRLFETTGDKITQTRKAVQQSGTVVLFKGPDTTIACPDGLAIIQDNAPATLATAGTGDVLAGFIAGLMAQGISPFNAACMATWIHGEAANTFGLGVITEDLIEAVPAVLNRLC
ncbi:MAG: NAD(P)H-hydrate dehydratase [Pseudomonadota bacterium]